MRAHFYIPFLTIALVVMPVQTEAVPSSTVAGVSSIHNLCELEASLGLQLTDPTESQITEIVSYDVKGLNLSEATVTLADLGVDSWQYPISPFKMLGSQYGPRTRDFSTGRRHFHHGQDIACTEGENIYAVADGTVVISTYSRTAGNYIAISHGTQSEQAVETRYLHLSRRLARNGRKVKAGDIIGRCGSTGQSTGAHLHFEVKLNEKSTQPFRHKQRRDEQQCTDLEGTSYVELVPAATPSADAPGHQNLPQKTGEQSRL